MSQVSLPMRIALLATLAFSGLWFIALRPKPVTDEAAPPAAVEQPAKPASAPGKAAAAAEDAVAKANAGSARKDAATGGAAKPATRPAQAAEGAKPAKAEAAAPAKPAAASSAKPSTAAASKPAGDAARPAPGARGKAVQAVLGSLADRKVVVLLFWDRRASDDQEVRSAVARVDRRGGKVAVHVAPIGRLADYEPITRGAPVVTSPTVLVIDRARRARAITGLTVTRELDETVTKALRVKP